MCKATGFNRRTSISTLLVTHPECLQHQVAEGLPECADRLRVIYEALESPLFKSLKRLQASRCTEEDLRLVHTDAYIQKVRQLIPEHGLWALDDETIVSPRSYEAALYAAGSVLTALDEIMKGNAHNAFCATRPPGHHASSDRSGGFCLFNNVALGVYKARQRFGLKRIAIVDFDAHHGDGTQEIVQSDPTLLFTSIHQDFPQVTSGKKSDTGPHQNVINMPMPAGSDGAAYRQCCEENLWPRLISFKPEIIFVSAGFDAHQDDPLTSLALTDADYAAFGQKLVSLSRACCGGRLIAVLEGGYALKTLGGSVASFVHALMDV